MITNSKLTIYHKSGLDVATKLEKWTRYNYDKVWFFSSLSANVNKGYNDTNNVEIRIPYNVNNIDINNLTIGDIIVQGQLDLNIQTQQDLKNYQIYNITSITNNVTGNNQHVHIRGI